jgi:hypothetical protein
LRNRKNISNHQSRLDDFPVREEKIVTPVRKSASTQKSFYPAITMAQ